MSEHKATIRWSRDGADFGSKDYSRDHVWRFDGGIEVRASAAPEFLGNPRCVDPESAFVAALSSCHMLTLLHLASKAGFQIDSYVDEAVGQVTRNDKGVPWVSSVTLHPRIIFGGEKLPTPPEEERLHHEAHQWCYIANSVKTEVVVAGRDGVSPSQT